MGSPVGAGATAMRRELAEAMRKTAQAEALVRRLEGEEVLIAGLLKNCEKLIGATAHELEAAVCNSKRMRCEYEEELAVTKAAVKRLPPEDAKKRRLGIDKEA